MTKNEVYVLFGNEKSIKNYKNSLDDLTQNNESVDYVVKRYAVSDYQDSKAFITTLDHYQEFIFISKKEFDILYHDLCAKARTFMKMTE